MAANVLGRLVPALNWLRGYRRADLRGDLTAGLTVGVMLVPQAMAYAMLAGLPPVVGLYASTVPLVVYALFGSSRQLAVGPVAMISLVVVAKCSTLAKPGSPDYLAAVLLLSAMVGVLQLAMGLARLGFVENFLSHSVVSGFTSAAAILIGLSQLKHLLGVPLGTHESPFGLLAEAARRAGEIHPATLAIGLASIGVLVVLKKTLPRFPAALVVVVLGTLAAALLRLDQHGVKIVGAVPHGLPGLTLPGLKLAQARALLPAAATIVFVGFIESIAVAEAIATKERYRIDANQELRALGLANIATSLFGGYAVTGGFSRTAVNYQAGARTGLASLVTAAIVLLTLLVLTPLFHYLPNAVLAAIVMVAVAGLVDLRTPRRLFRLKKSSSYPLAAAFVGTLVLGVEGGVALGVALSVLLFVWRSAHPHSAELGFLPHEGVFRNVARYPQAQTTPDVLILRVDASLYFANMSFLEDLLRERVHAKPHLHWVLMDLSGVNDMDACALDALERLMEAYEEVHVRFAFAGMKGPVRDLVERAGWPAKFGRRVAYLSLPQALEGIRAEEAATPGAKNEK